MKTYFLLKKLEFWQKWTIIFNFLSFLYNLITMEICLEPKMCVLK